MVGLGDSCSDTCGDLLYRVGRLSRFGKRHRFHAAVTATGQPFNRVGRYGETRNEPQSRPGGGERDDELNTTASESRLPPRRLEQGAPFPIGKPEIRLMVWSKTQLQARKPTTLAGFRSRGKQR